MTLAADPPDDELDDLDDLDELEPGLEDDRRPARPGVVELAGALLIVSGVLGLVGTIGAAAGLPAGAELILVLTAALNLGSIAVGFLVRFGRAWLLDVNYVAVLGFLDLVAGAGSGLALLLGIVDILVVVILLLNKPWFDAMRRARQRSASERRVSSPPVGGG
jgi:hypothetical protein